MSFNPLTEKLKKRGKKGEGRRRKEKEGEGNRLKAKYFGKQIQKYADLLHEIFHRALSGTQKGQSSLKQLQKKEVSAIENCRSQKVRPNWIKTAQPLLVL